MMKLIIFDLDGTLINAYPAVEESLNYTLAQCGLPGVDAETIKRTVGWGDRHLVQTFTGEALIDQAIGVYRAHHADALRRGSSLLPGTMEILTYLKQQGYLLAVASNRPKVYSLIVMEHLTILPFFDCVFCGDEMKRPKPDPEILWRILDALQVKKDEAVFAGDMAVDIETGKAAGIRTVAVTTGSCSPAEIQAAGPWRVIPRIDDLAALL